LSLSLEQLERLGAFQALATDFNKKLNLYSRGSVKDFWERHILHSLTIGLRRFPPGARVVDWGSGGGLPGIPLAVLFPEVEFVLVDSVGKKMQAVQAMARRLGLANVDTWHGRAETWDGQAHYAVSRATAPLSEVWGWTRRVLTPLPTGDGEWRGGLLCLKGAVKEVEEAEYEGLAGTIEVVVHPLDGWLAGTVEEKLLVEVVASDASGATP